MDRRGKDGELPPWNLWETAIGEDSQESISNLIPWISGGNDDNLPLTRLVQHDLWLHQHPKDCSNATFLLAHWHSDSFPIGAGSQITYLSSILSLAVSEGRVFVTLPYHGANHQGCTGQNYMRWSCYFAPEASKECISRAMELYSDENAWNQGILKKSNNTLGPWSGVPRIWGEPWKKMRLTEELNGAVLGDIYYYNKRRWWRAQAYRYLMRFPSEYLCNLLNQARHQAFGIKAARAIVLSLPRDLPVNFLQEQAQTPLEEFVWSKYGPWIPRPIVSIHVRQGDKGGEMTLHPFKDYINLANTLRRKFPDLENVWLSTEMQSVVDETMDVKDWKFYFTKVERQSGTIAMTKYMKSLGKRTAFDNSYVNLMMAVEADLFVGALGSGWSYIIDCMRMTNGKLNAGFLSVNSISKD
ncbi:uncharacterized protein LOC9660552 [Selaginella moellendorffii]|uniref:uncharacterized protein LOC9660552 n=1 Tax=Selaginella moellendorffii TaxID=88036 RepID=UPI000D1CDEDD|nr:uncharacterized protein LOC9660552 [Selaginella moellendorffii]|eukprot:XP_024520494.1 uncharacterized protein LOC9660552 [Selaginella moellendorffii]